MILSSVIITYLLISIVSAFIISAIIVIVSQLFRDPGTPAAPEKIFQKMQEAVIGIDPEYKIRFVNLAAKKIFKIPDKTEGKPLHSLITSKTGYDVIINNLLQKLREGENAEPEKIWVTDESLPVIVSAVKMGKGSNNASLSYLILTDLSIFEQEVQKTKQDYFRLENHLEETLQEKKRIELLANEKIRELHTERARLESAIQNLSLGFIALDKNRNVTNANTVAINLFDLHFPSVIPVFDDIADQIQSEPLRQSIEASMQKSSAARVTDILFKRRFFNFYISPIIASQDTQPDEIGAVILIEDVTESKIMNRSKEEFFTIASHELRTPLTAIRGFVSLLKAYYGTEITDSQIQFMIDNIETSSKRLIGIVNDFLDSSKIEQGKLSVVIETCDLYSLIDEVIKECMPMATQKKLFLTCMKSPESIFVRADKIRLKQVLVNLIGNAIKFTETGGISLQVSTKSEGMVLVKVIDSGKGIPEKNKYLLFNKFNQAGDDLYTRDASGTGLGLYISKLLIGKMGGTIQLESSDPGIGTTFSFTIPLAERPS